ncbi:L-galactose dehydrogenase [Zancudomyces culisetae]|uniref:L-galactose dehydrogenase n=1 Tax=Zancudomyces culisetae TaxID=1213189 RepID=A0A1R1PP84_ZANCU|nr:L-galactose dehydrogenase [Zancudomyces culisetae]|eukprot:OMH82751.1 L-galactose dehydrogenase [Zancudomyces culisetae]
MKLSKIGLGAGTFSGFYDEFDNQIPHETVVTAFQNGINWVDTSPYYGDSEIRLGKVLQEISKDFPRNTYMISTKVGRYGYHKKDFDYSAERVEKSVMTSLERLGTDYLDYVFCHDVEFIDDIDTVIHVAIPQLFKLKEKGVIRNVGISEIQYKKGQPLDIILTYCHANIHNKQGVEKIKDFRRAGVKTVVMASPLSMGLLRSQGPPDWHPASKELKDAVRECVKVCSQEGVELADLSLRAAFSLAFGASNISPSELGGETSDYVADGYVVGMLGESQVYDAIEALADSKYLVVDNAISSAELPAEKIKSIEKYNACISKVSRILAPFQSYTWPSPDLDA